MGSNPSGFEGDNRPVESVSWGDCQEFCRKLGEQDGKRYRLPTEAEWEYACRAGTTTDYCSGDGRKALRQVGWCSFDGDFGSAKETKPVGQFQPNAWGLYDMHGNVWEWCQDGTRAYASIYYETCLTAEPEMEESGDDLAFGEDQVSEAEEDKDVARRLRGGSWYHHPEGCCSASGASHLPSIHYDYLGCRVVLCLD
jgi:formylglycine-generating enzyme required for sulfatase activity